MKQLQKIQNNVMYAAAWCADFTNNIVFIIIILLMSSQYSELNIW